MHRKPAYYIAKRALSKVTMGSERKVTNQAPYITTGYLAEKNSLHIWAVNGSLQELAAVLRITSFDIATGKIVGGPERRTLTLAPNQTTELGIYNITNAQQTVVVAYIEDHSTWEQLA